MKTFTTIFSLIFLKIYWRVAALKPLWASRPWMLPLPCNTTKSFFKFSAYSKVKRIPPERSAGTTEIDMYINGISVSQNDNSLF